MKIKEYIDKIISFDSLKESVEWFWNNAMEDLKEYDAII